jgi:acyl-coenzyme A thioesterase PaaI-like protein
MNGSKEVFFQDFMPENVCFGCGKEHPDGLRIKSFWEGDTSVCLWQAQTKYAGWSGLLNGGVIATLIDCHCMCTAMAAAYRDEGRLLDSLPEYRYATGSLNLSYKRPTPIQDLVRLEAKVIETKGRKTVLSCVLFSREQIAVAAEVVAIRVFDSSVVDNMNPFK